MYIDVTHLIIALALISGLTTLATEGVKKLLDEANKKCAPNLLAAILSAFITVGASIFYVVMNDITINAKVIVCIIAMIFLSFLCATVGFDKVKQLLLQIEEQSSSKEEKDQEETAE